MIGNESVRFDLVRDGEQLAIFGDIAITDDAVLETVESSPGIRLVSNAYTGARLIDGGSQLDYEIFISSPHLGDVSVEVYPLDGRNQPTEVICLGFDGSETALRGVVNAALVSRSQGL